MSNRAEILIYETTMSSFYTEIASLLGHKHCLLSINYSSKFSYQGIEEAVSLNYSLQEYHTEIFNLLLLKKEKLYTACIDEELYEVNEREQDSKYSNILSNKLVLEVITDYKHEREISFKEFVNILKDKKFGKYYVQISYCSKKENQEIASFLFVFNRILSNDEIIYLKYLSYKRLYIEFFSMIYKKYIDKINQQQKAEMAYLGHTLHTIFPATFADFKDQVKQTEDHFLVRRELLKELFNSFTLAHIIFQFASNQLPKELTQKNVIDFLELLKCLSISVHNSELLIEIDEKNIEIIYDREDCKSIFLLLWNLWHNAAKYTGLGNLTDKKRSFIVKVYNHENRLTISFLNNGIERLKLETKQFLIDRSEFPHPEDYRKKEGAGCVIVKRKADILNWKILVPDIDEVFVEKISIANTEVECNFYSTQIILITNIILP